MNFGFENPWCPEYLVIISPSNKIKGDVKIMKKMTHSFIGLDKYQLNSIAHITLFNLIDPPLNEKEIFEISENILRNFKNFRVYLKHVEYFNKGKNAQTLVIKIENPEIIKHIHASFLKTQLGLKFKTKTIKPHVTIAKGIPTRDKDKIPQDPFIFNYEADFECDGIVFLRRFVKRHDENEKVIVAKYEIIKEIKF
ncbi:MAG: 2'-5' RNA ligase family protein [Bacteroidota bacterium]